MSMELLRDAGIAVPRFKVATSSEEVYKDAKEIGKLLSMNYVIR